MESREEEQTVELDVEQGRKSLAQPPTWRSSRPCLRWINVARRSGRAERLVVAGVGMRGVAGRRRPWPCPRTS
jgi:hypothetical protein